MFKPTITSDEINNLELKSYEGPIVVVEDTNGISEAFKEIDQHEYIGFDTETKPVFVKGQYNHVALIQIAIPGKVFLFRINKTGVTEDMILFFKNQHIKKIGVALRDDIKDLQRLRPFSPNGFIGLEKIVKPIGIESNGLRKLTAILLGFRVSKNSQVSNWEATVLQERQVRYAATDAWVCLEMYNVLLRLNVL